ncbi:MAG TPA: YaiO family outer membrane beta-barrel protein [Geothrix sp.]|nr:YaiO family outer membrane beta-barrel protein [Geothrix sp.]
MTMRVVLMATLPLVLSAQEDPFFLDLSDAPTVTRIAVGAYDQAFSDQGGHWKGWTLEGTIYPGLAGPWVLSATGFDRPEGKGVLFSGGKYFLVGQASSVFLALGGGTNEDFLPRLRADLEVRFGLGSGWKLDLAGALNRYSDNQDVRLVQAGPAYVGKGWSLSVRGQQVSYDAGAPSDTGAIMNVRIGNSDFGMWHQLRLAAGRGILETSAAGARMSTASSALAGFGGRFGRGGTRASGASGSTTSIGDSLPQERLVSLSGHWPLTGRFALQAEAAWGERVSANRFWGGSLQVVVTF